MTLSENNTTEEKYCDKYELTSTLGCATAVFLIVEVFPYLQQTIDAVLRAYCNLHVTFH